MTSILLALAIAAAPETPAPKSSPPGLPLGALKLRLIGPSVTSGRVVGVAVHPRNKNTYYVAAASGGVWKTTNAGTTFTPIFDSQSSYSIGCVVIDPKNPETVWVGSGENNSQRSVSYGDGVYKSIDGGRTWNNVGLKTSEHIGRIAIDPRDSNVVYVAAQGPLWAPGGERGLYKTSDGGKTWNAVLTIDENTGVTDVVIDQKNPDTILAASYQRRRHVYTLINGGPGSAIHRSTDGGKTWKKISAGLPGAELGRVGLAAAPSAPETVYAVVEAADNQGGIHASMDFGQTWEKRNPFDQQGQYYAHAVVDPHDSNRLFVMSVRIQVSDDGGRTLSQLPERDKHVDNHCIWVDPTDQDHMMVGCDGGLYTSYDRAKTWRFHENLPITQFYDCGIDQNPSSGPYYHVYGGTQDNFTLGGPVRTRSSNGIPNSDWYVVQGGDGFHCAVDPGDPNTVYAEAQYGVLTRFDRKTGTNVGIQPVPAAGEPPLRWNWDSPLLVSPHNSKRLYFGANKLFQSEDRGDGWTAISPDLSRQLDRDALPVFGVVAGPEAVAKHVSTSFYGNLTALAESYQDAGHLYAGTDDGLIQVTKDGGKTWTKSATFPGVPEKTYVAKLVAGHHAAGVVYAAFDNHKNGDFKPYLYRSDDAGATWKSINGTLPERGTVYCLAEDPVTSDLLFCGTEFGLFVTRDAGKNWQPMKAGLPTIAVRDLRVQKANNDLVVATFGRGFYILDDYSVLRSMTPELLAKPAAVIAPAEAMLTVRSKPLGGNGNGFLGASYAAADNPPFGYPVTVHLKESPKSKKQLRKEAEKAAKKSGGVIPYPKLDELRAEAEEEAAENVLVIGDTEGHAVRTLSVPTGVGLHRISWDFREASASSATDTRAGPLAPPGRYSATLFRRANGTMTKLADSVRLTVTPDPAFGLTSDDYAAMGKFNDELRALRRRLAATATSASELQTDLEQCKAALDGAPTPDPKLAERVRLALLVVKAVRIDLTGDRFLAGRNENAPVSVGQRVASAASNDEVPVRPTGTQRATATEATKQLDGAIALLRPLVNSELPAIEARLGELGAPPLPGRLPK